MSEKTTGIKGSVDCCDRESIIDRDGIIHDGSDSKGGITRAGIDTVGG